MRTRKVWFVSSEQFDEWWRDQGSNEFHGMPNLLTLTKFPSAASTGLSSIQHSFISKEIYNASTIPNELDDLRYWCSVAQGFFDGANLTGRRTAGDGTSLLLGL